MAIRVCHRKFGAIAGHRSRADREHGPRVRPQVPDTGIGYLYLARLRFVV